MDPRISAVARQYDVKEQGGDKLVLRHVHQSELRQQLIDFLVRRGEERLFFHLGV